jgi:dTDP-4-amino-4,6-dideoxygalactose transaminase
MKKNIYLYYPYISASARLRAYKTYLTRWIGQGSQVDEFEIQFEQELSHGHQAIAVNSGTSALHLAYVLADIKVGDEVIVPVFSCAATMMPVLYQGAKVVFADIQKDTMNIDPDSVRRLMNEKVKAIVCMDYGGNPCDLAWLRLIANKWNVPLIEDAAQAIGAKYDNKNIGEIADYTCFSFQAIKALTTVDGGMLTIRDGSLLEKAERIRWFGIDRKAKFANRWNNDITEVGYKYQMSDVTASLGIEGLKKLPKILKHQKMIYQAYKKGLQGIFGVVLLGEQEGKESSHWLNTILVERRADLMKKLAEHNIESSPTHYRCDKYSVFGGRVDYCKNMDWIEENYLVLPSHYYVTVQDVEYICNVIRKGW